MSAGIDYGSGMTNIDLKTGIRFGVISARDLNEWVYESFTSDYGEPTCPNCGNEVNKARSNKDYRCKDCKENYWSDQCFGDEPVSQTLDDGEYKGSLDSYNDIFLVKSPYYTLCKFCSPCAPGAGHMNNPCDDGVKTYCFGHEWFDGNKAPYTVYRVKDDSVVEINCNPT